MSLPTIPVTRNEQYLSAIAGEETQLPSHPVTREEQYLDYIATHGGGGGASFEIVIAWDGETTPDVTKIPAGVTVTHGGQTYTGTLAASSSTMGKMYFVAKSDGSGLDLYTAYASYKVGSSYYWEAFEQKIDLSAYQRKATVKATLDATLADNTIYDLGTISSLAVTLPSSGVTAPQVIAVRFSASADFTATITGTVVGETSLTAVSGKTYEVVFTGASASSWVMTSRYW